MIFKKFGGNKKVVELKKFIKLMKECLPVSKFAWLPVELSNEDFVWMQFYFEVKYKLNPQIRNEISKFEYTSDPFYLKDGLEKSLKKFQKHIIRNYSHEFYSNDENTDIISFFKNYVRAINCVDDKIHGYVYIPGKKKDKFIEDLITMEYKSLIEDLITLAEKELEKEKNE